MLPVPPRYEITSQKNWGIVRGFGCWGIKHAVHLRFHNAGSCMSAFLSLNPREHRLKHDCSFLSKIIFLHTSNNPHTSQSGLFHCQQACYYFTLK